MTRRVEGREVPTVDGHTLGELGVKGYLVQDLERANDCRCLDPSNPGTDVVDVHCPLHGVDDRYVRLGRDLDIEADPLTAYEITLLWDALWPNRGRPGQVYADLPPLGELARELLADPDLMPALYQASQTGIAYSDLYRSAFPGLRVPLRISNMGLPDGFAGFLAFIARLGAAKLVAKAERSRACAMLYARLRRTARDTDWDYQAIHDLSMIGEGITHSEQEQHDLEFPSHLQQECWDDWSGEALLDRPEIFSEATADPAPARWHRLGMERKERLARILAWLKRAPYSEVEAFYATAVEAPYLEDQERGRWQRIRKLVHGQWVRVLQAGRPASECWLTHAQYERTRYALGLRRFHEKYRRWADSMPGRVARTMATW